MPIYMDRHDVPGVTAEAVAEASKKDVEVQADFGIEVMTYWVDEERGNAFCLMKAPDKKSVSGMHHKSHGMIPHEIIEVDSNVVEAFLGRIHYPGAGRTRGPKETSVFNDPAFRSLLVAELKDHVHLDAKFGKSIGGELKRNFNETVQKAIYDFRGRIVESHEEFMASFISVENAVECALHIGDSIRKQNAGTDLPDVELKIGISAGIPVTDNNKFFGDSIKLAKRLSFVSRPGKINTSALVKQLYKGKRTTEFDRSGSLNAFNSKEEQFLIRLVDTFQKSMSDQETGMEEFCTELGVSKSQLYRKTVSLTGLSPNDFLKEIRLSGAIHLMRKENKNISETSYEMGFTNPSYFTKCFKKRYLVRPADFIKSLA